MSDLMIAIVLLILSLAIMIIASRRIIWLGIFIAGLIVSIASANPIHTISHALIVALSPINIILALAVALIPLLGGLLNDTGLLNDLRYLGISQRKLSIIGPAVMGLLPIPGGAILSAPLIDAILPEENLNKKGAINVWFRHVALFLYPLNPTIIITASLVNADLQTLVIMLFPCAVIYILIGYLYYLLRSRNLHESNEFSTRSLYPLIFIILPVILIIVLWNYMSQYLAMLLAISITIIILVIFASVTIDTIINVCRRMRIWDFALLMIAIFFYAEVIKMVMRGTILTIFPHDIVSVIFISMALGFITGRILLSLIIVIPFFATYFGLSLVNVIIIYAAAFVGYLISPMHPCLITTAKYFNTTPEGIMREMIAPAYMMFTLILIFALLLAK